MYAFLDTLYSLRIADLESERKVTFEEGQKFAAQNNLIFLEASAKDGTGVDDVITITLKVLTDRHS